MKIQYKHQKFQADAAKAVVDVFAGQPYLTPSFRMDKGSGYYQMSLTEEQDDTGWCNQKIVPELSDRVILEHIQKIQRGNQIEPSRELKGKYNLTVEMETGVGKTYTYIKTIYELNRAYGWSKFIVVVPSIAVREGVYKSFQMTQEHFAGEYGRKIRFFIYNSAHLTDIDHFAADSSIHVMIINSQAFNAKGKDARRIYMKLDEFRSRRPIEMIAKTNPVLIIDEPQSVEGPATKEGLKRFNPLLTLRYSATHKADSIYNMVYRLDAMEAYNKKLVKKIAVKGITEAGGNAASSYIYLESINLSQAAPTATISIDCKTAGGAIRRKNFTVGEGCNLYSLSNELGEYRNGFVVKRIDGRDDFIEFLNGTKIHAGEVIGEVSEDQIRRIQIRETILSHIDRERRLFSMGIKVLSLFFVDEVANYREYADGLAVNGKYADMFEEEYRDIVSNMQREIGDEEYMAYLEAIQPSKTHAGYFSIDKKGRMTNSRVTDKREGTSDDINAYDLIMKNKELLLERDPGKSPVRFIFSHSALREGWDNPNVFQICTLKQSGSNVRKRQEVGRGLRLCVNRDGERMDVNALGNDVHNINVLTVIASESYDSFAKGLQTEMADAIADRPKSVTVDLFANKVVRDQNGNATVIDTGIANRIFFYLVQQAYIDPDGALTDKYYEDRKNEKVVFPDEIKEYGHGITTILDSVYNGKAMQPENARRNNVELKVDYDKLNSREFRELWNRINKKSVYTVDFDTDELVRKSISALDSGLRVTKTYFRVEAGHMDEIKSKDDLASGSSFVRESLGTYDSSFRAAANGGVKYDLVGKLVDETKLTRKAVVDILTGIAKPVFNQFRDNPEEFIAKAAAIINEEKAAAVIEHITYRASEEKFGTEIFTEPTIRGRLGVNAMKAEKHLYDHIVYDSVSERRFAEKLDAADNVAVYVKLPEGFFVSTPVGRYTPDWAIAFCEGTVKHIYFVTETKGTMNSAQLRFVEESKIHCAGEHFKAICGESVVYNMVDSFEALQDKAQKLLTE